MIPDIAKYSQQTAPQKNFGEGFYAQTPKFQHDKQHHKKVLLSSFQLNGHTFSIFFFHPQTKTLELPFTTYLTTELESSAQ